MTGSGNPYHDWWTSKTPEEQAAYQALLLEKRVVACHFALKPGLFGGHPVEVLPDDTPLLNGHAKAAHPFRRKAAAAPAVAPSEVDAMSKKRPAAVAKAMKHPDKPGAGAKKRKALKGDEKVEAVMSEFKRGTLHSGSGGKVTSRKQAVAIAMSEAGKSKPKKPAKKAKK